MHDCEVSAAPPEALGRIMLGQDHALAATPWVLYDGDCPFCTAYSRFARISAELPGLRVLNARDAGPEVDLVTGLGLDLDEGMVLQEDGALYYGRACMHRLSQLATRRRLPNRALGALMRPGIAGEAFYRALVRMRHALLFLMGRKRL